MRAKFHNNICVVICTAMVFAAMFVFFTFISPSVPYDADDWNYLSSFSLTPIPIPPYRTWNPTRIFPEHMMPAAGFFSAFVICPLTGDYILSISITTALLLSSFLALFYLSLYRLFITLNNDKTGCALTGLLVIALCFALFKRKPAGNLHLFIVYSLNLHYFYTLPNLLNSIAVCELMRLFVKSDLSLQNNPRKAHLIIALLYFCIFSILFSVIVLLAFAVSILLLKFAGSVLQRKEKFPSLLKSFCLDSIRHNNIVIISIIGILFAIFAESRGGRANWDSGSTWLGSVFSIEFAARMYTATRNLLKFAQAMNSLVFALMVLILCAAAGVYIFFRKRYAASPFISVVPVSALSCAIAFLCVVMVSAKGGTQYANDVRSAYSIFFFWILFVSLAALYLHKKIPLVRMLFPLMTVLVVMIAVNTRWPYAYPYSRTHIQTVLIEGYIKEIVDADLNNESEVVLHVPKYNEDGNWPIPVSWWGDALSSTLYRHHIISKIMEVKIVPDENLPTP